MSPIATHRSTDSNLSLMRLQTRIPQLSTTNIIGLCIDKDKQKYIPGPASSSKSCLCAAVGGLERSPALLRPELRSSWDRTGPISTCWI